MNKLKHFWVILALVTPLGATKVYAQFGAPIDLLAPVQEDIIRDLEQNGSSKKPSPVQYRPSYSPDFIKALQECDNEEISGHISAQRVTEDVDFTHPLLLQRARECGAISSERLEKLLYYQRKYYNVDRPDTIDNIDNLALDGANLVAPPRRVNPPKATAPREEIIGVGIRAIQEPKTKKFLVVETIKDSPASISGVLPKDIIVKIDNLSTNGMSLEQLVKLIRGAVGTEVRLGVLRQGKPLNFTLKRERFVVQSRQ